MSFSPAARSGAVLGVLITLAAAISYILTAPASNSLKKGAKTTPARASKQSEPQSRKGPSVEVGLTRPALDKVIPSQETAETAPIPEEWEIPLMDALINQNQSSEERAQGLIRIATVGACGVPRVQEECLKHLLYSLSDEDRELFKLLATDNSIPLGLRTAFLQQTLALRPQELGVWLSESLSTNKETSLVSITKNYLQEVALTPQ